MQDRDEADGFKGLCGLFRKGIERSGLAQEKKKIFKTSFIDDHDVKILIQQLRGACRVAGCENDLSVEELVNRCSGCWRVCTYFRSIQDAFYNGRLSLAETDQESKSRKCSKRGDYSLFPQLSDLCVHLEPRLALERALFLPALAELLEMTLELPLDVLNDLAGRRVSHLEVKRPGEEGWKDASRMTDASNGLGWEERREPEEEIV